MTQRYQRVVALDFSVPSVRLENVAGDVCNLHQFADRSIDLVFCAEVLEHIPDVRRAASEIARVAKKHVVIGVPYRQDIRLGRVTCQSCGRIGPPWGHVNSFNEKRLAELFPDLRMSQVDLVGSDGGYNTTAVAAGVWNYAGNPWGTGNQRWPCSCGELFRRPEKRNLLQKAAGRTAVAMDESQSSGRLRSATHPACSVLSLRAKPVAGRNLQCIRIDGRKLSGPIQQLEFTVIAGYRKASLYLHRTIRWSACLDRPSNILIRQVSRVPEIGPVELNIQEQPAC